MRAAEVYERLGSPEGELALAECVVYLAVAPKSNAVYMAYNAARAFVARDASRPVPLHLRNAPTRLMKDLGYGKGYRYAHDEAEGYAAGERYLPDGMEPPGWYQPTDRGLEAKIREKLAWLGAATASRRKVLSAVRRARGTEYNHRFPPRSTVPPCSTSNCSARTFPPSSPASPAVASCFDEAGFRALEDERKGLQTRTEELQAKRNALSKQVGIAQGQGRGRLGACWPKSAASATS